MHHFRTVAHRFSAAGFWKVPCMLHDCSRYSITWSHRGTNEMTQYPLPTTSTPPSSSPTTNPIAVRVSFRQKLHPCVLPTTTISERNWVSRTRHSSPKKAFWLVNQLQKAGIAAFRTLDVAWKASIQMLVIFGILARSSQADASIALTRATSSTTVCLTQLFHYSETCIIMHPRGSRSLA